VVFVHQDAVGRERRLDVGEPIEIVVETHVDGVVRRDREVVVVDVGPDPLDVERPVATVRPLFVLAFAVAFALVSVSFGAFKRPFGDVDRVDVVPVFGEVQRVAPGTGRDVERTAVRQFVEVRSQ
jgi:hypothetical protein